MTDEHSGTQQLDPSGESAVVPPVASANRKTGEERKELLARTIQGQIARGGRVESQSDYQAVLVHGRRPNHLLHFILGFPTLGFWWLVWIGIAIFGGEKREMAQVDEFGNVSVQKV